MNFNRSFIIIILISFITYGCTGPQEKGNISQVKQLSDSESDIDSILYPTESDTIHINIQNGAGHLKIHKREREYVNLAFNSQDFTKMTATLSSKDSTANIRFNQIVMPNGDMDGPFSSTISYDLPVKGDYLLFIHENQMAGDPWSGDFEISISLSK